MNRMFSDINDAVQRYVTNKMSDAESEKFEAYFLSQPEIIEMIEDAQMMRVGLGEADLEVVGESQPSSSESFLSRIWALVRTPIPAYAAVAGSAIITAATAYLIVASYSERQPNFIAFGGQIERSNEKNTEVLNDLKINLAELQAPTIIQFKVHRPTSEFYKVYLYEDSKKETVWISKSFKLGEIREYNLRLPDFVKKQVVMRVAAIEEDGAIVAAKFCNVMSPCK